MLYRMLNITFFIIYDKLFYNKGYAENIHENDN